MKCLVCCAILLLVCVFTQVQGDCKLQEDDILTVGTHIRNCVPLTCNEDGSISSVGCPESRCRNQIGYQELDLSKPYPECCARPICKDD